VSGFVGMRLVANELEDQFGNDDNDMPMLMYHDHFVASIESSLMSPWMEKDQWVEKEGQWRRWKPSDAHGNIISRIEGFGLGNGRRPSHPPSASLANLHSPSLSNVYEYMPAVDEPAGALPEGTIPLHSVTTGLRDDGSADRRVTHRTSGSNSFGRGALQPAAEQHALGVGPSQPAESQMNDCTIGHARIDSCV